MVRTKKKYLRGGSQGGPPKSSTKGTKGTKGTGEISSPFKRGPSIEIPKKQKWPPAPSAITKTEIGPGGDVEGTKGLLSKKTVVEPNLHQVGELPISQVQPKNKSAWERVQSLFRQRKIAAKPQPVKTVVVPINVSDSSVAPKIDFASQLFSSAKFVNPSAYSSATVVPPKSVVPSVVTQNPVAEDAGYMVPKLGKEGVYTTVNPAKQSQYMTVLPSTPAPAPNINRSTKPVQRQVIKKTPFGNITQSNRASYLNISPNTNSRSSSVKLSTARPPISNYEVAYPQSELYPKQTFEPSPSYSLASASLPKSAVESTYKNVILNPNASTSAVKVVPIQSAVPTYENVIASQIASPSPVKLYPTNPSAVTNPFATPAKTGATAALTSVANPAYTGNTGSPYNILDPLTRTPSQSSETQLYEEIEPNLKLLRASKKKVEPTSTEPENAYMTMTEPKSPYLNIAPNAPKPASTVQFLARLLLENSSFRNKTRLSTSQSQNTIGGIRNISRLLEASNEIEHKNKDGVLTKKKEQLESEFLQAQNERKKLKKTKNTKRKSEINRKVSDLERQLAVSRSELGQVLDNKTKANLTKKLQMKVAENKTHRANVLEKMKAIESIKALGGVNEKDLAEAIKIAELYKREEINRHLYSKPVKGSQTTNVRTILGEKEIVNLVTKQRFTKNKNTGEVSLIVTQPAIEYRNLMPGETANTHNTLAYEPHLKEAMLKRFDEDVQAQQQFGTQPKTVSDPSNYSDALSLSQGNKKTYTVPVQPKPAYLQPTVSNIPGYDEFVPNISTSKSEAFYADYAPVPAPRAPRAGSVKSTLSKEPAYEEPVASNTAPAKTVKRTRTRDPTAPLPSLPVPPSQQNIANSRNKALVEKQIRENITNKSREIARRVSKKEGETRTEEEIFKETKNRLLASRKLSEPSASSSTPLPPTPTNVAPFNLRELTSATSASPPLPQTPLPPTPLPPTPTPPIPTPAPAPAPTLPPALEPTYNRVDNPNYSTLAPRNGKPKSIKTNSPSLYNELASRNQTIKSPYSKLADRPTSIKNASSSTYSKLTPRENLGTNPFTNSAGTNPLTTNSSFNKLLPKTPPSRTNSKKSSLTKATAPADIQESELPPSPPSRRKNRTNSTKAPTSTTPVSSSYEVPVLQPPQ